jgi:hypothetical protein
MARASYSLGTDSASRWIAWISATAILSSALYLVAALVTYRLGFPLDDSWIHAAFARNLALSGQWALRLGHPSGGSTSPVWTVLLLPGYLLGLGPLWWSYILGAVQLAALALVGELATRRLSQTYSPRIPWVGVCLAVEWHLVWAAMSGMETLLQALILTICLVLLLLDTQRFLALGMLVGLSVWIRPDGLSLLLPTLLTVALRNDSIRSKIRLAGWHLFGVAAIVLPYVLLNLWLSARPMPTTFYAKQAEYAAWQARPVLTRLAPAILQTLTGPLLLLLPGLFWFARSSLAERTARRGAVLGWSGIYVAIYALRLPPYQHGRYLIPAMPIMLIMAAIGFADLWHSALQHRLLSRILRAWGSGLAMFTLVFLALGARAYGQDVGLIESEMVNTAQWVHSHIPEGDLVAAHDIGALGYFDNHPLLDLAGLISPEVIPFMRDQAAIAGYLDARGAKYLVSFPGLYPALEHASPVVYTSRGPFAPTMGQANMTVYCWACP